MEAEWTSTQRSARRSPGRPDGTAGADTGAHLEFVDVPATAEQLPSLRHALLGWARRLGLPEEQVEAMSLATYEAMANTVEHAYADTDGTLDFRSRYLPLARRVEISVTDHGHWHPPPAEPGPLSGRGLPLMRQLADIAHIEPDPRRTTVHLQWTVSVT